MIVHEGDTATELSQIYAGRTVVVGAGDAIEFGSGGGAALLLLGLEVLTGCGSDAAAGEGKTALYLRKQPGRRS